MEYEVVVVVALGEGGRGGACVTHDQPNKRRRRRHFRLKSVDISFLFWRLHSDSEPRWCRMPYPVSIFNLPSLSSFTFSPHKMCGVASLGFGQRLSVTEAQHDRGDFWSARLSVFNFGFTLRNRLALKAATAEKNDRVKMRSLLTRSARPSVRSAIHFGRGMTPHFAGGSQAQV